MVKLNKKTFWILTALLVAGSISAYAGGATETAQDVLDILRDATTPSTGSGTPGAPPAPTGVTAVRNPAGSTNVLVRWNAVSGATSYKVYFSRTNGGIGAEDGETTATSFNGEGYSTDRTYYFRVSAVNSAGEGTPSSWVELGSGSGTGGSTSARLLGAPAGVTAVRNPAGSTNIRVSWNAVSGATSYKVYWSNVNSGSGYLEGEPTTTSFISEDNQTNETHYFRVTAVNAAGEGTASSWISVGPVTASGGSTARVPGEPAGMSATRNPAGSTTVRVSWNAVSGATSYRVYWSYDAGSSSLEGEPTTTTFTSTGKRTEYSHYFRVSAVNAAGEGVSSAWVYVGPAAASSNIPAPTGVTAVRADYGDIRVSWNAVSGATRYRVYNSYTNSVDSDGWLEGETTTTSFTSTDNSRYNHYFFRVTAVTAAGEGAPSPWVMAEMVGVGYGRAPATPTGLTASRNSNSSRIELRWNDVSDVFYYILYYSTDRRDVVLEQAQIPGTDTGSNKRTDATHYFRVSAVNLSGESAPSAWVSVGPVTGRPPGLTTGVTAVRNPAGSTTVRISWNAVNGATSYRIYESSGSDVGMIGTSTTTSFTSTSVSINSTRYFYVTAVNAAGEGAPSARVTVGPVTR